MKKRLGDYIQEYSVRNKSGEDIPVYSITNSQGFCRDYFSKEVASKDKTTYKIVPRGCFAYNPSRINVGSVDWQRDEERVIVSPLYNVFSVSPEIDQQYLYYYLKSSATLYRIKEVATGSVRDNLRLSMLYDFMIELPSLDVQRQIVSNLDLLASIIRQRNQQLTKLDELIKARFVEMFGDLVENPKQFPCVLLGSIMTVMPQNGLYKPQSAYVQDKFGTPILRIDGFYNGKVTNFNNLKRLCCTDFEKKRYLLVENDIVINRVNSIEYLGKCARISGLQEDTVFESNMMRFHLDDSKVNSTYITTVLCSQYIYRQILTRAKKAVNQASINQGDVQSLNVVVPPLSLQNQFAAFVAEVDKSKLFAGSAVAHKPFDIEFFSKSTVQRPIKEV